MTVKWLSNAKVGNKYKDPVWYRAPGIEDFVKMVDERDVIVGITFHENLIGFILEDKNEEK